MIICLFASSYLPPLLLFPLLRGCPDSSSSLSSSSPPPLWLYYPHILGPKLKLPFLSLHLAHVSPLRTRFRCVPCGHSVGSRLCVIAWWQSVYRISITWTQVCVGGEEHVWRWMQHISGVFRGVGLVGFLFCVNTLLLYIAVCNFFFRGDIQIYRVVVVVVCGVIICLFSK